MYYCPVWPKSRRARPKRPARANPMPVIRKIRWCGRIRTSVRLRCLTGQSTFHRFNFSCPGSRRFAICRVLRVRRFFSSATRAHAVLMYRLARFSPVCLAMCADPERYHLRQTNDIRTRFGLSFMVLFPLGISPKRIKKDTFRVWFLIRLARQKLSLFAIFCPLRRHRTLVGCSVRIRCNRQAQFLVQFRQLLEGG